MALSYDTKRKLAVNMFSNKRKLQNVSIQNESQLSLSET